MRGLKSYVSNCSTQVSLRILKCIGQAIEMLIQILFLSCSHKSQPSQQKSKVSPVQAHVGTEHKRNLCSHKVKPRFKHQRLSKQRYNLTAATVQPVYCMNNRPMEWLVVTGATLVATSALLVVNGVSIPGLSQVYPALPQIGDSMAPSRHVRRKCLCVSK